MLDGDQDYAADHGDTYAPPPAKKKRFRSYRSLEKKMGKILEAFKKDQMEWNETAPRSSYTYSSKDKEMAHMWRCYLRHYLSGLKEAKQFQEYYSDKG